MRTTLDLDSSVLAQLKEQQRLQKNKTLGQLASELLAKALAQVSAAPATEPLPGPRNRCRLASTSRTATPSSGSSTKTDERHHRRQRPAVRVRRSQPAPSRCPGAVGAAGCGSRSRVRVLACGDGLSADRHPPEDLENPLDPDGARANLGDLLDRPHVRCPGEGTGFWKVYEDTVDHDVIRGNLVSDAHIAALMRQHGVGTIWTADRDFRRFADVASRDPYTEPNE